MADRSGKSFDVFLIQRLKESAKNENIQQSTNPELKVWMSWASNNGWNESIEELKAEALKNIREKFTQQFVREAGKIASVMPLVYWLLLSRL